MRTLLLLTALVACGGADTDDTTTDTAEATSPTAATNPGTEPDDPEDTDGTDPTDDTDEPVVIDELPGPCSFSFDSDGDGIDFAQNFRYDLDGRMVYFDWDDGGDGLGGTSDSFHELTYADDLLMLEERFGFDGDGATYSASRTSYTHDGPGETQRLWDFDSDGEVDNIDTITTVDGPDGGTVETTASDYGADGEVEFIVIRHRSALGDLFLFETDSDADGVVDDADRYVNTYDADGNLLLYSIDDGDDGDPDLVRTYEYDDSGNRLVFIEDSDADGSVDVHDTYTYAIDDPALPGRLLTTTSWGDDDVIDSVTTYVYDGTPYPESADVDIDGDGSVEHRYLYEYDADGNPLRTEYDEGLDGVIDWWSAYDFGVHCVGVD